MSTQTADLGALGFLLIDFQFWFVIGCRLYHNENIYTMYNRKAVPQWPHTFDNDTWIETNNEHFLI